MAEPSIVITVLRLEYTKAANRLAGARKRRAYAEDLIQQEEELIEITENDVDALKAAILEAGGELPEPEQETRDG